MSLPDERIKHLEFLQTTIGRQASNSFAVKGWSLTVAAAVYVYTASHLHWWLAVVALLPPVAFGWLDAFYLRQERLFRALYDAVIEPNTTIPLFSMDTKPFHNSSSHPRCGWRSVITSNTWRAYTSW